MKIKSRVISFGYVLSILVFIGSLAAIVVAVLELISGLNVLGFATMPLFGKLFFFLVVFLAFGIYGKLLWDSNIIEIDNTVSVAFSDAFKAPPDKAFPSSFIDVTAI